MTREARCVTPTSPPRSADGRGRLGRPGTAGHPDHPLRSVPLSEPVRLQAALSEQLAGHAG
ncbi:MAG: hypothetical protein ACRDZ4_12615 [Egibacteraceae bacterium]